MCIYTKGIKFVLYCLLIVLTLHSNARFLPFLHLYNKGNVAL